MLKRAFLAAAAACTFSVLNAAEVVLDPFFVYSPRVMAQGGSFTAVASGHEALFTNPAGFHSAKGSLTLASFSAWAFGNPSAALEVASAVDSGELEEDDALLELLEKQSPYGFGGGASLGVSYVGRGLGLGVIASTNLLLQGDAFPLGVGGVWSSTIAVVGGFAVPLQLGPTRLVLGGDLRPMIRLYSPVDAADALTAYFVDGDISPEAVLASLNSSRLYQGAGLGIDVGAKWELGPFTIGLSARDLFDTRIVMYEHRLGDYLNYAAQNGLPLSNTDYEGVEGGNSVVSEASDDFYIPMAVNAGIAFRPDLGALSFFFDPTFHFDLVDPVGVLRDGQSPWALLHLGAEARVFRFVSLRGGVNQGYLTAGAGVRLLFLDLNASIFTRELGPYAGDRPNTGVSLEAAIRF